MFSIPEICPSSFKAPEIKHTLFLTPDQKEALEKSLKTIEHITLESMLGIRIIVNHHLPDNKALWFDGKGKLEVLDLSGEKS